MNSHGAALGFPETTDWNFKGKPISYIMKLGAGAVKFGMLLSACSTRITGWWDLGKFCNKWKDSEIQLEIINVNLQEDTEYMAL